MSRLDELDANVQLLTNENNRLRDKENFHINELSKHQTLLTNLEKEKSNLEFQFKNIEKNINQNELFLSNIVSIDNHHHHKLHNNNGNNDSSSSNALKHSNNSSDLVNGKIFKK